MDYRVEGVCFRFDVMGINMLGCGGLQVPTLSVQSASDVSINCSDVTKLEPRESSGVCGASMQIYLQLRNIGIVITI